MDYVARVNKKSGPRPWVVGASLLLVVMLWGGNNTGTRWLVGAWPPVFTGMLRFLVAGPLLVALLRLTPWLGRPAPPGREVWGSLWMRGGLSLAAYTVAFCWALRLTTAAHVALYIGASPVWALLVEERPRRDWSSVRRYAAAFLALGGVAVLFAPVWRGADWHLAGESCGFAASLLWANYNHQSRVLSRRIPGVVVAAYAMGLAGIWLLPLALWEVARQGVVLDAGHVSVQALAIVLGGVVPYALWNSALHHWPTSRVMLFNNLIPVTTTVWAYFVLGEPISGTFWVALMMILTGVLVGQSDWRKVLVEPEGF